MTSARPPRSSEDLCAVVGAFARSDPSAREAGAGSPPAILLQVLEEPRPACRLEVGSRGFVASSPSGEATPLLETGWQALEAFLTGARSYSELLLNGDWRIVTSAAPGEGFAPGQVVDVLDRWSSFLASPHRPPEGIRERAARLSERLGTVDEIPRIEDPGLDRFRAEFMDRGRPVVLEAACRTWTFDELAEAYEGTALLRPGSADPDGLSVADLLRRVDAGAALESTVSVPPSARLRRRHRSVDWLERFDVVESARRIIIAYADVRPVEGGYKNATIWHCDLADNFLSQLAGTKRVMLIAAHERETIGVEQTVPALVDNVEWDIAGDFSPSAVTISGATLSAGDVLFLPCGWFHNVVNLAPSCVMTTWVLEGPRP